MKYCAFLRGVNVKGTTMKMAEVCKVFENSGVHDVSAVLATGNILFSSGKNAEELKQILQQAMALHFDYDAFIFIKTDEEVAKMLTQNPLQKSDDFHVYLFVTAEDTENLLLEEFRKCKKSENEDAAVINHTFYWQVQKGNTLHSDFGKILGKKAFKDKITSRNINTFEKIVKNLNKQ